jgi:hypothetical protein
MIGMREFEMTIRFFIILVCNVHLG